MLRPILACAVFVVAGLVAAPASALTLYTTPYNSPNFDFTDMEEDSETDATPLFGAPTGSGDVLVFTPTNFTSVSGDGGADQTAGTFKVTISSNDPATKSISEVLVVEQGDYQLAGVGTDGTSASALAGLFIAILKVNNGGSIEDPPFFMSLTSYDDTSSFDVDTPAKADSWGLGVAVDVQAAVDTFILSGDLAPGSFATKVRATWNNDLATTSESGTTSLIQKKFGAEGVRFEVVPEPSTVVLLAGGLALLAAGRRRN